MVKDKTVFIILMISFIVFASAIDWTSDGIVALLTPINDSAFFDLNNSYEFTGNASTQGASLVNISLYHNFNGTWLLNQSESFTTLPSPVNESSGSLSFDSSEAQVVRGVVINSSIKLGIKAVYGRHTTVANPRNFTNVNISTEGAVVLGTATVVPMSTGQTAQGSPFKAVFTQPIQIEADTSYRLYAFNTTGSADALFDSGASNIVLGNITFAQGSNQDTDLGAGLWAFDKIEIQAPNSTDSFNWSFNTSVPFGQDFSWSAEGCATDNTCGFSIDENFTVSNNLFLNSETFQSEITEGGSSNFELNFSSFGKTLQNVFLTYNNTNFTGLIIQNEDNYSINLDIVSPIVTATINKSFFWSWFYSDGTVIDRDAQNQTVNNINIDDCDTHTVLIYNYTLLDEENKTMIGNDSTVDVSLNLYDIPRQNLIVNFSQRYENLNPIQICLQNNLTTEEYRVYSIVKYSANDTVQGITYAQEYHNVFNESLTNESIPNNINLFDLKNFDSTEFQLIFRDSSATLAPNILVYIYRQYVQDNDFKIVEAPLTDSDGKTVLHLVRNEIIYNMVMINEAGQIVATFNNVIAFCQDFTIGQCTIRLNAPADVEDLYDYETDIGVSYTKPTFNNETNLVSLSFVSLNLSVVDVRLEVTKSGNFGNRSVCVESLSAVSGTLNCNVSSIVSTDRFLFAHFFVNDDLKAMFPIDLQGGNAFFGVATGAIFSLIIILIIVTSLMSDKKAILIGLAIGWVMVLGLGLINGALFGIFASGIWLLITILIMLWKMSRGGTS